MAIDVGALILIEKEGALPDARIRRLVLLAHLAGLLHDIRRDGEGPRRAGRGRGGQTSAGLPDPG
ncbi:MAG: hypothetical protein MZV70_48725 [Desulfobacterales bacterium]|nr:hypothetical protein [Desulfobacterales bacterium]